MLVPSGQCEKMTSSEKKDYLFFFFRKIITLSDWEQLFHQCLIWLFLQVSLRQEGDGTPRVKQQEIHFLWTDTLRQEQQDNEVGGGARPDHTFLILEVRRPPSHKGGERLLGDRRGVMPRMLYPQASWLEFTLPKRGADTPRGSLRFTKQSLRAR